MAVFYSQTYNGRYLDLTVTEKEKDAINNRTKIHWKVEVHGANGVWYSSTLTLKINGVELLNTPWRDPPIGAFPESNTQDDIREDDMWISHSADGTKTIYCSFMTAIFYRGETEHGGNVTLSTIDRNAPSISQSAISGIGADKFKISATSDTECKNWEYKLDSGDWTTLQSEKATSVSKVITGLSPATEYSVQISATRVYNEVVGTSNSVSATTLGGAVIVSTQPVSIDLSRVINFNATFYNADYTNKLTLKDGDTILINETSIGTHAIGQNVPMTWEIDVESQSEVLNHLSDTKNKVLQLQITSYDGDDLIGGGNTIDITFSVVASFPTLEDFSYEDSNSASVGVSGDNQKLIQSKSTLRIKSLSATALNGATISSWKYEIGQQNRSGNPTSGVFNFGAVNSFGDLVLKITVTDSRGNSASKSVNIKSLRYSNISVENYYLHRTNNTEAEINFELTGSYTNVGTNSLRVHRWRYREQGTTIWGEWRNFNATGSMGSYSFDGILGELDTTKSFDVYVEVGDKLSTTYFITTVLKGLYLMMFRDGRVGINTNEPQYDLDIQPKSIDDTNFFRVVNGIFGMTDTEWANIYKKLCLYAEGNSYFLYRVLEQLDAISIGTITLYGGNIIPRGWLECNGLAISRTEYADLFSVIGTKYGAGDGSTTFNLPNISLAPSKYIIKSQGHVQDMLPSAIAGIAVAGISIVGTRN